MKKCAFPHARHIYSLENYFTGGRWRSAWGVLTLADGEPHETEIQPKTRIDRVKMAQSSCSFATNCKTKCYFFCTCQGRQELVTINSWVRSIKKHLRDVNVSQKCVSSEKKLLLARIGLAAISQYASNIVHNLVRDSDLRVRKCQYPPHKNRRRKVEREVNLRMAEEIKAGGESSWWQDDCKTNKPVL